MGNSKLDWEKIESDVLMSLRCLRAAWEHTEGQPIHAAMLRDLYLPCLRLLLEFCACVKVETDRKEKS